MTWTEKLKQFSGFGGDSSRSETAALLPLITAANLRLSRVAELAPTPVLRADVDPVVGQAAAVVQRIRDLLRDFGTAKPAPSPRGSEPDGHNHWARLLQALEHHREVRQRLREVTISVEDTDPALSRSLEEIGRDEDTVLDQLRDLIARADPQALN